MRRRHLPALLIPAVLAGCGGSTISEAELEAQVKDSITKSVGTAPKRIDCPGDLDAEVGATMKCTLVAPDDSELDADVKVTSVKDGNAAFDVKVGTEVRPPGD